MSQKITGIVNFPFPSDNLKLAGFNPLKISLYKLQKISPFLVHTNVGHCTENHTKPSEKVTHGLNSQVPKAPVVGKTCCTQRPCEQIAVHPSVHWVPHKSPCTPLSWHVIPGDGGGPGPQARVTSDHDFPLSRQPPACFQYTCSDSLGARGGRSLLLTSPQHPGRPPHTK